MLEYEPKYPLEILDSFLYPNLSRDGRGKILSENFTSLKLRKIRHDLMVKEGTGSLLGEVESKVKECCSNVEVAYRDTSGNRWFFLLSDGTLQKEELTQMQRAFKEMHDEFLMQ